MAIEDARQQIDAVLPRQREVEENQIVGLAFQLVQALDSIRSRAHAVAFQHQQGFERFTDGNLVIDDEDAGGLGVAGCRVRGQDRAAFRHAVFSLLRGIPDGRWCRVPQRYLPGCVPRVPG